MNCPNCGLAMDEVFRKDWIKKFRCRCCGTVDTSQTLYLSKKEAIPFSEFYHKFLCKQPKTNDKLVQTCTDLTIKCTC